MVNKANADSYGWGENCKTWLLVDRQDMMIAQEQMPPHTSEVRHLHQKARQFFYVLSGEAVMDLDTETVVLHANEGIQIEPKTAHTMTNRSDEMVEFLVTSCPSVKGDRVNCKPYLAEIMY
jgi:mannose-6-phosphate isomerase-like protein (cupin superfamily)